METITSEENLKRTIDQFWETVPPVWRMIRNHLRVIASEQFGISVGQFQLLRHVRKGLTSIRDIAEARQVSRPAVSQEADLLFEKGLITRCQEAGDRRFVRLSLTSQGEDLLEQVFELNRAWMMEKMASFQARDLDLITEGLALFKSAFDTPMEELQEVPPAFIGI